MRIVVALFVGLITIARSSMVAADEPLAGGANTAAPSAPAYRLSAEIDVPALLLPAAVSASWFLAFELAPPYCAPRCNPNTVNFIDRPAAGLYSPTWGIAGDIATVTTLLSMPVFLVIGEGPVNGLNDLVVVGQATLSASATQVVVSFATSRPRPRLYGTEAPDDLRDTGHAARSFFSGHTATGLAATISTFRTLQMIHRPGLAWASLGVGLAGSTFLSLGRVGAGSHFPTDVLAGAAVGAAFGILLPAVHPKTEASSGASMLPVRLRVVPVTTGTVSGAALAGVF